MKANFAFGGLRLEIRRDVIDCEKSSHTSIVSGKQSSVPIFWHSARIDEIVAPF